MVQQFVQRNQDVFHSNFLAKFRVFPEQTKSVSEKRPWLGPEMAFDYQPTANIFQRSILLSEGLFRFSLPNNSKSDGISADKLSALPMATPRPRDSLSGPGDKH